MQKINPNWAPASKAVDMACVDDGDDGQVNRQRYNSWVIRGFKKLRYNLLRQSATVLLKVNPRTGTAKLPDNFQKLMMVAYFDGCGDIVDVPEVAHVDTSDADAPTCGCTSCSDHSLCGEATYQRTEEIVTMLGVDYTKVVILFSDKNTGTYKRQTTEPVLVNGAAVVQTRVEDLCTLETLPCGCIAPTETNWANLRRCCCCTALEYFAHTTNQQVCFDDYYTIDEENYLIHVSAGISTILLKYRITLPCINGIVYVPEVSLEALAAFAIYKMDRRRRKMLSDVKLESSRKAWTDEKKELRRNLMRLKPAMLIRALNQIPH